MMRDGRRCTHVLTNGGRCEVNRDLELHHIIAVSDGGSDHPDNLQTLCSEHHQLRHPEFTISSQRKDRRHNQFGYWVRESEVAYEIRSA